MKITVTCPQCDTEWNASDLEFGPCPKCGHIITKLEGYPTIHSRSVIPDEPIAITQAQWSARQQRIKALEAYVKELTERVSETQTLLWQAVNRHDRRLLGLEMLADKPDSATRNFAPGWENDQPTVYVSGADSHYDNNQSGTKFTFHKNETVVEFGAMDHGGRTIAIHMDTRFLREHIGAAMAVLNVMEGADPDEN